MKKLSDLLSSPSVEKKPRLIHFITGWNGLELLENATLSTEISCPLCSGIDHYVIAMNLNIDPRLVWICANDVCVRSRKKLPKAATITQPPVKRSILWPSWCEINHVGDVYHDLTFDQIKQPTKKIEEIYKFATKPFGVLLMQGSPGSGKTFACLGMCELFTRTNPSCVFFTQKKMFQDWLQSFQNELFKKTISSLYNCNLLIIDDFGTGEPSPGFMSFFMDLIDNRMQWKNKGTVITTNLDMKKFSVFCGEALSDRVNTGVFLKMDEKSRRKRIGEK